MSQPTGNQSDSPKDDGEDPPDRDWADFDKGLRAGIGDDDAHGTK